MNLSLRGLLRHFNNRISEVSHAIIMIGLGLQIITSPHSEFRALDLLTLWAPDISISSLFMGVGATRMAALIANGNWPQYGPWLRAVGALVGALIWSQMFLSLMFVSPDDLASLGAPMFFVFTTVEFLSIYRALAMRDHYGRDV